MRGSVQVYRYAIEDSAHGLVWILLETSRSDSQRAHRVRCFLQLLENKSLEKSHRVQKISNLTNSGVKTRED